VHFPLHFRAGVLAVLSLEHMIVEARREGVKLRSRLAYVIIPRTPIDVQIGPLELSVLVVWEAGV
jgi:hypothetical protein